MESLRITLAAGTGYAVVQIITPAVAGIGVGKTKPVVPGGSHGQSAAQLLRNCPPLAEPHPP